MINKAASNPFSAGMAIILVSCLVTQSGFIGCIDSEEPDQNTLPPHEKQGSNPILILPDWTDKQYHGYTQTSHLINKFERDYPHLIDIFSLGKSVSNRDIWCVKITNEQNHSPKLSCIIDGCIHGSEWESCEICLYVSEYLLINSENKSIGRILNTSEIYLIPLLNPDGRENNDRYNDNGIDLNRNFDVHFGRFRGKSLRLGPFFGKRNISVIRFPLLHSLFPRLFPSYVTNCGRTPFSEPETKALYDFLHSLDQETLSFYVNCHTAVHVVASVINIDTNPEYLITTHEKNIVNDALRWCEKNTQYDVWYSNFTQPYGAGLAHHWVFKEFHIPSFLFELLSQDYEPGLTGGGPHDDLVYWMEESLPFLLFFLYNIEQFHQWKSPIHEPLLPKEIPS